MSINQVVLSGNLTSDPELRATANGSAILSFRIAVNERKKQGDQWVDEPNYFPCYIFGNRANAVSKYLSKGTKVFIQGHLRWHEWTDKNGNKHQDTDVIVEEIEWPKAAGGSQMPAAPAPAPAATKKPQPPQKAPMFAPVPQDAYANEDIPF